MTSGKFRVLWDRGLFNMQNIQELAAVEPVCKDSRNLWGRQLLLTGTPVAAISNIKINN